MPIRPENKARYPRNWKQIRADILKRADNKCEFCGIENYAIRDNGSKVILTIAHLDHTPENCDPQNLRALCQKCHNSYDAPHRAETRRKNKLKPPAKPERPKRKLRLTDAELGDLADILNYAMLDASLYFKENKTQLVADFYRQLLAKAERLHRKIFGSDTDDCPF